MTALYGSPCKIQHLSPLLLQTQRPQFSLNNGILYRWVEGCSQLVVPTLLRKRVLYLAHDPSLVGHLRSDKTTDCVTVCFYWPGIRAQVQKYCASFRECQLQQEIGQQGGPLQPMPIIAVQFERI